MTDVFKLSAPIRAYDDEVVELTLRRPTPLDARQIKALPYAIDKDETVAVNTDVAAKYIAVCAGIPPSSVNQLDLVDFNALCWMIVGFFMKPASRSSKTSTASPTTSPTSGGSIPS